VHVRFRGGVPQDDADREPGPRRRHLLGPPDEDGLLVLGNEARAPQAAGQVGREVVAPGLPLHGLPAGGEVVALAADEPVEVLPLDAEVAGPGDQPAVHADDPHNAAGRTLN
jgi:hypothetical protein